MSRPPLGTLVVVGLLAAATAVAGTVGKPTARPTRSSQVEVVGATSVCPDLRQVKDVLASRVSVGAAPLPAERGTGSGYVEAIPNGSAGAAQRLPVREPGQVAVGVGTGVNGDALVVSASGVLAAGLEAEQVTRGESGRERGLAGQRCEPARTEAWFVGGATMVGDSVELVLVNVDDTPSTVDVSVFSSTGPADQRLGQGITVQPHARRVLSLDELAPDRDHLTVHVASRRGRVAAGLHHTRVVGGVPYGTDWVPQAVAPAQQVVVPGIPQGPGRREVTVANPGSDDTVVSVRVTTTDGQFVPTGFDAVDVKAGSTSTIPLNALTNTSPLSVTVSSEGGPVVAGAYIQDGKGQEVREFSYSAGTAPLSGPALMTDLVIDRPTESTLILTAPEAAVTLQVTPIRVLGTTGALPAAKTVRVPEGRTAFLRLSTFFPPGATAKLALEVRPLAGSGPVYAARYLRERGAHGPLTTMLVLIGPAQRVERPGVAEDSRYAD